MMEEWKVAEIQWFARNSSLFTRSVTSGRADPMPQLDATYQQDDALAYKLARMAYLKEYYPHEKVASC